MASREMPSVSVETEGNWSEVRPIARAIEAGLVYFCFVATEDLATEILLCFRAWSAGLPLERSSSNFSWSKWMTKFSTVTGSTF